MQLRANEKAIMQAVQNQILQEILLSEQGVGDEQLAEKLGKDLQEIRFHLDELYRGGFLKLFTSRTVDDDFYFAESLTLRGCMVLQKKISLDDKGRTGSSSASQNNTYFNIYGGKNQIGGKHNTQNISINSTSEFADLISQLSELINNSSLLEDDKEEVVEAIQKLPELAMREQTPGVLERVQKRLTFVNNITKSAKELYETVRPLLIPLYAYWKIHFPE